MNSCKSIYQFGCHICNAYRLHGCTILNYSTPTIMYHTVIKYTPPKWAECMKNIPKVKVELANKNTPIHHWALPGLPEGCSVGIKRDDMTGCTMSGNKVRKLEFLMADAISQNFQHVITCGGIQSNHCRAVAVCARELGLQPHLILRTNIEDEESIGCSGNLLIDRLCAAKIYLAPLRSPYLTELKPRMDKLAEHLHATTGKNAYLIPVGGSNAVGVFGYISAFEELLLQGLHENFDDIVFACGSGGTAAGLAIANYLTGSKLRIHGIAVSDDAKYFHQHCNEVIQLLGLTVRSEDILDVIEGHKGQGYGISTQQELDFLVEVSTTTGIMLDPVYTGKAVKGMVYELNHNLDMFKGTRILFIHTGGVFGLYDERIVTTLKTAGSSASDIKLWTKLDDVKL